MPQGDLPAIDKMGPAVEALNESALTALALRQREDFRALERFVDAETARVRGAQDHLSPKLDLYLDTQRVYLRYTQSLHNDAAKGLVAKATAAESNARINVSELHTHIQLDIADVLRGLRGAWLDWQSLSQSLHRLEGVVGSYEKQAKAGAIDRADLLASQDQAAEVRHELVDARLRFASALATLRLVTGSLMVEGRTPAALAADFYTLPTP
jgi:outer membrane protein TolC